MNFFRKYQRYVFIIITAMIIFSFVFFGTFSTFVDQPKNADRVIAHAIDGSKLMQSEIQELARFIATDRQDAPHRNSLMPNFCNDGVIRYDLIQTGLAEVLASHYFPELEESIRARLEKAKRFRPYAHPEAPFLSVAAIWDRFVPGLNKELASFQAETDVTKRTFSQLAHLYEMEGKCPSEWVRRILLFQKQQYSWLRPDPRLEQDDIALFGFHTASDWFGTDFVDLCSEFILNAARAAERKGYKVSIEEAKADLINNFSSTVQKIKEAGQEGSQNDLNFHNHLRRLGFDEKSAVSAWRNVLLFRRYFQGVGQSVFVDKLPFTDFASFALESAVVQLYEWPRPLRLKRFSDLAQLQYYIEAVSNEANPLSLPSQILSLEEIETKYPELVQTTYSAKVAKSSKEEIGLRASVKEVWDWELENWETLRAQFSFLSQHSTRDERFKALEALPMAQRRQIDTFARSALVDAHPEWIESSFGKSAPLQEIQVSQNKCSLAQINKIDALTLALETAQLSGMPFRYSDNGSVEYLISDVKLVQPKHLVTFEKAKAQGILSSLLDKKLEAAYPEIREKFLKSFKTEEGKWKPLADVKDLVASKVYQRLLNEIDQAEPSDWDLGQGPLDSYPRRRLVPETKAALAQLQKNNRDPRWIQLSEGDPLVEQFKMEMKEHQIQRIGKEEWMKEEAFTMLPNQWSSIHVAPDGEIAFFYFQEKKPHQAPILEQLVMGKETIAADAQRFLAERIVLETKKKRAIVIPIRGTNNESF